MDPLSVAASVAGLIASTGQIAIAIRNFTSGMKDAPKLALQIMTEVQAINAIICQLKVFLIDTLDARTRQKLRIRGCLVLVEEVVTLLTSCVRTCSDLEAEIEGLKIVDDGKGMRSLDRVKWVMRETTIKGILEQVQTQKSSLTCMMGILQAKNTLEAENIMERMHETMQKLVDRFESQEEQLSRRIRALEARDDRTIATTRQDRTSVFTAEDETELQIVSGSEIQRTQYGFAFEEDLRNSRPYRNPAFSRSGASLLSTEIRTTGWSILSGLSLSDVSNISILALPIYANEISNSGRYQFGIVSSSALSYVSVSSSATARSTKLWRRFTVNIPRPFLGSLDPDQDGPQEIFGVPIDKSIYYASVAITVTDNKGHSWVYGYIPTILAKTGVYLKQNGASTPGLFHTSGSAKRMTEIHARFNSPPDYGKSLDWTEYTVHDAAGIMLRYLNLLPQPLVPPEMRAQMLDAFKNDPTELDGKLKLFQDFFQQMKPLYRQLLLYLIDFLAVVSSHMDENQLSGNDLGKIFCRGLLTHSDDSEEIALSEEVIDFLIINQDHFVISPPETERTKSL
ncbi:Rho GTPase activation protein [Geopyxis carbonaria]|nr:Rho GTPase activation protein [Geopyxis carbonaria]